MNKPETHQSKPALDSYLQCANGLPEPFLQNVSHFKGEFELFWQKWTKLHTKILACMMAQFQQNEKAEEANDAKQVNEFLKKRSRLLSVFIQRLQEQKIFDSTRLTFAELMRQHDENFRHILQSAQNEMRRELKKAYQVSKAVKGYAKSSTFGG